MSDHEPPLAFDPRRPVRGAGPVPVTLIVSALVLLGLIGGVAYVYRGGIRHPDQPPAPVGTQLGDIKGPAPADAPTNDPTAGLVIEKVGPNDNALATNAVMAPEPETPQPRVPVTVVQPAAPPATPPPPVKVATAKPPATPPSIGSIADAANAPKKKPVVVLTKPPATPASPPAGAGWVQIGAFTSTALAEKGWTDVARFAPAAMAGKGKKVEPVVKGGSELYRTYVTGFTSHADAVKFCAKLTAAKKPCMVK